MTKKKDSISIIDLFSGCGGLSKGFHDAGFEIILANEVWEPAIASYKENFPDVKMIDGDIRKAEIKEKIIKESKKHGVDIIIGGPPCFIENTPIITRNGYKKIQEIRPGDSVLTHTGNYQKVMNFGMKKYEGNLITIKLNGHLETYTCTENHPILVRKYEMTKINKKIKKSLTFEGYIPAKEIEPKIHYLSIPITKEKSFPNLKYKYSINQNTEVETSIDLPFEDEEFWFLIGFYLAEGCYRKDLKQSTKILKNGKRSKAKRRRYTVIISVNKEEAKKIIPKYEKYFKLNVVEQRTALKIQIHSKDLWWFVNQFGTKAYNKILPEFIQRLPKIHLKEFIKGWVAGDGHERIISNNLTIKIVTTSPFLALDSLRAIIKAYETHPSVSKIKVAKTKEIEGRIINQRDYYEILFRPKPIRPLDFVFDDKKNIMWIKVDTITWKFVNSSKVWNIEVENDNTYCTPLFIAHNCQGYSSSGYRNPLDERGSLFKEYATLIKEIQPKIFLMENVKGILSMKGIDPSLKSSDLANARKISRDLHSFKAMKRYKAQRDLDETEEKEWKRLSKNHAKHKKELKNYLVPLIEVITEEFMNVGYEIKIKILNSADFGVPQKRNRVFIIGMKKFNGVDPFPEPNGGGIKTVKSVLEDLEGTPNKYLANHVYTKHGSSFLGKIQQTKPGESVFKHYKEGFYRLIEDEPSPTVKENHGSVFLHYKEDRVLTPRELARLQSFPDDFIFKGTKGSVLKQVGNAVPPDLGRAIAEKFFKILEEIL